MSPDSKSSRTLISVVMPARNAQSTIREAIRSALDQTWRELELLVMDDGSTDGTAGIVRSLAARDERIRFFQNETNRGVSWCRNFGVEQARGEWIAFLDSDDLWRREKLEKQMALVRRHGDAGLFFTGSGFITADGKACTYQMHVPEKVSYRQLLKQNVISCSSVLCRRELLERHPMENDAVHEDFAVWLRILREEPLAWAVDEPLLMYRVSASSKSGNKWKAARMTAATYRFVGEPWWSIAWNGVFYTIRGIRKFRAIAASRTEEPWKEE